MPLPFVADVAKQLGSLNDSFSEITVDLNNQTGNTFVYLVAFMILVVLKVTVKNCGRECTDTEFTQIIHQRMNDLRNGINTCIKSHKTNKCVSKLVKEGMEILNTQQTRQTVVVWIWCRTQAALEHIQDLYESNQMREVFFDRIPSSISILIRIQRNQFKKTAGKFFYEFTH